VAEVAVGDGKAGVAELVLDEVHRVALFGEFGGMGVAQAVGVDPFVDPGPRGEAGEELADIGGVEGPPARVQNSRCRELIPRERRRSAHRSTTARASGSRPTVRALSPLPWRTRMVPRRLSMSLEWRARASPTRRPPR